MQGCSEGGELTKGQKRAWEGTSLSSLKSSFRKMGHSAKFSPFAQASQGSGVKMELGHWMAEELNTVS